MKTDDFVASCLLKLMFFSIKTDVCIAPVSAAVPALDPSQLDKKLTPAQYIDPTEQKRAEERIQRAKIAAVVNVLILYCKVRILY